MQDHSLTERERQVLEAVIRSYVKTAEPAGSRSIAKNYRLGISAATIRNTMSDLEDRGYLYHPHTSAGRIPTDLAYRVYVDRLMEPSLLTQTQQETLDRELRKKVTAIETILYNAAKVLGVLTQELGFAITPSFEDAVVEQLQLLSVSSDRILMVLVLRNGAARTIFIEVATNLPSEAIDKIASVLNERLTGLSLREIRATVRERLRDYEATEEGSELLNIFVEEADQIFDITGQAEPNVMLGSAQMLAEQPEFHSQEKMRDLLELTERRDVLTRALRARHKSGVTVTIGGEHLDPKLSSLTLVTSTYERNGLSGVLGVMGPTRMPYEKIVAIVEHTSRLIGELHR
ncbi:MAG: heat-inducible transcription repressor HrcA [Gemmatimonadetes bacterium]|nr:heat-inducible transcription repressor HrcA [Gemmatimonadota bacterium]MCH7715492.1 heat-inducible transcription repressor HrcA [Gemmatimonadota bacterium]